MRNQQITSFDELNRLELMKGFTFDLESITTKILKRNRAEVHLHDETTIKKQKKKYLSRKWN